MSSVLRKLRIIAIPLTRPNVSRTLPHPRSKPSRLVYYQFQIASSIRLPSGDQDSDPTNAKTKGWLPEEGIAKWATNKAADTWAGFGKEKSGWKSKIYRAGERMMDRLDFEELALKSIDLSLSPSVAHFRSESPVSESKKTPLSISLEFPPSLLSHSEALSELRGFVEHRMPKHRKGFYLWILPTPLTIPFKFIPIIPNLPFFFCVWRSWSHYRAYKSSQYLQSLLDHHLIVPEASETLNEVYRLYPPTTSSPSSNPISISESSMPNTDPEREFQHTLLLAPEAVPAIISLFELESTTASADLHRAIEQARLRVASGRADL